MECTQREMRRARRLQRQRRTLVRRTRTATAPTRRWSDGAQRALLAVDLRDCNAYRVSEFTLRLPRYQAQRGVSRYAIVSD